MTTHNWKRCRKKPIEVEYRDAVAGELVATREGELRAREGDYVIRGVQGECYPIGKDIFHQTYDVLERGEVKLLGVDLVDYEIEILREVAGEKPARPWGAAVGAALGVLTAKGYVDHGCITDKGQEALRALDSEE